MLCDCWLDGRSGWANRPTFGLDGLFFLLFRFMVAAFPFYSVCVPPLLSSFSSLLCLLSCLRCRYPSLRSSIFRPALSILHLIPLSLLRALRRFPLASTLLPPLP